MGGYHTCLRFPELGAPRREEKQAMKDTAPCKNCERRTIHPNCHATCEQYVNFINEHRKYQLAKQDDNVFLGYVKERTLKRR